MLQSDNTLHWPNWKKIGIRQQCRTTPRDTDDRREVGLCTLPRNHRQVKKHILDLTSEKCMTYEAAAYLNRNFVPAGGGLQWNRVLICKRLWPKRKTQWNAPLRAARDEWRNRFRHYVAGEVTTRLTAADPTAFLKYGVTYSIDDQYMRSTSSKPIPARVRAWIDASLPRMLTRWVGDSSDSLN
jgi:hypothetical protein